MKPRLLVIVAATFCSSAHAAYAQSSTRATAVPRDTFDAWMARVSNAGRWGADDQVGTLNLITPERRRTALGTVRDGVSISLASDLVAGPDPNAFMPFRFGVMVNRFDATVSAAVDTFAVLSHGYAFSHVDALSHFAVSDRLYNAVPRGALTPAGAQQLGVERMSTGIVSRGVLVDIPRLRNVAFLPAGDVVTVADIEAWERAFHVRIDSGDVVLIRTGRGPRSLSQSAWRMRDDASGPHPGVALWLHARGVAALGSDVGNEASPSLVPGIATPMHLLAIVGMGMPLFDNLDLERAAEESAARSRWTFLFIASPLRIRGGTGSPINPLAIF